MQRRRKASYNHPVASYTARKLSVLPYGKQRSEPAVRIER